MLQKHHPRKAETGTTCAPSALPARRPRSAPHCWADSHIAQVKLFNKPIVTITIIVVIVVAITKSSHNDHNDNSNKNKNKKKNKDNNNTNKDKDKDKISELLLL